MPCITHLLASVQNLGVKHDVGFRKGSQKHKTIWYIYHQVLWFLSYSGTQRRYKSFILSIAHTSTMEVELKPTPQSPLSKVSLIGWNSHRSDSGQVGRAVTQAKPKVQSVMAAVGTRKNMHWNSNFLLFENLIFVYNKIWLDTGVAEVNPSLLNLLVRSLQWLPLSSIIMASS